MTVKELMIKLLEYDSELEVKLPIFINKGVIGHMEDIDNVYTNISEDGKTVESIFFM